MLNGHALTELPLSTRDIVRFTPAGHDDDDAPPVFLLAVPSYREAMKWRKAVSMEGANFPDNGEMLTVLRAGVTALVTPEEQPKFMELFDQYEAAEEKTDALNAELDEVTVSLQPYWPDINRIFAERKYWLEIAPLVAAQMFLRGWENVPHKFERRGGLVPEPLLDKIGRLNAMLAGHKVMEIMRLSEQQSKNSASPSRSPSSPPAIAAGPTQATAAQGGTSAESSMSETPASN